MGSTLAQWRDRIEALVRDSSNVDVSTSQVDEVGIGPALAQFSIDRPRQVVEQGAGAGSAYLALPASWSAGHSDLLAVEYPTGDNPPTLLDEQSWRLVRDPDDVNTTVIALHGLTAAVGNNYRLTYTAPWPTPDADAATDLIDSVSFVAVTSLAASFLLNHLAAEAARQRDGAIDSDFVSGDDRHRTLLDTARAYRETYDGLLGRGATGAGPVSRRMDYDPARSSLFHGGRR